MAYRRHSKSHRRSSKKNFLRKTLNSGVSKVNSTSRKYMPKVRSGLESVGSKVVNTSKQSVPFLQGLTRKVFGAVGLKSGTKKYRRRRHR